MRIEIRLRCDLCYGAFDGITIIFFRHIDTKLPNRENAAKHESSKLHCQTRARFKIVKGVFAMITKDMRIVEVLQVKPEAAQVFGSYGMGCIHCLLAHQETV